MSHRWCQDLGEEPGAATKPKWKASPLVNMETYILEDPSTQISGTTCEEAKWERESNRPLGQGTPSTCLVGGLEEQKAAFPC